MGLLGACQLILGLVGQQVVKREENGVLILTPLAPRFKPTVTYYENPLICQNGVNNTRPVKPTDQIFQT